jgi:hypothetical protein
MATKPAVPAAKIADTGETAQRGHAAWKRGKVLRGIEQAENRDGLIPSNQVWRKLGLER